MKEEVKFSIIIPTYNRAHTIERALSSVQNQTYQDFEVIVIDDGSTDNTSEVLSNFQNIHVISQENRGVSHARNQGINIARNPWLCFLDSDDEWLSHKLEKQALFIKDNPGLKWVHGEEIWYRNGVRVNPMKKHKKSGGDQFLPSLNLCLISPSTVCIHRDIFKEVGLFREDFIVCEDYDLWLKISDLYPIGFIKDPIINKYGGHDDQLSSKYHSMDMYRLKSLLWLVENRDLDKTKKEAVIGTLVIKAEILIRGYIKHGHKTELTYVKAILEKVKNL